MVDTANIMEWRRKSPWKNDTQIAQDLMLSRALIEFFNQEGLSNQLAFRGGTALQKLFYEKPTRYSEGIELVQIIPEPIDPILDRLSKILEPWLGKAYKRFEKGVAILLYQFQSSTLNTVKIKVEVNTQEHFSIFDLKEIPFEVESPWYTGKAFIKTYEIEELLGIKLRTLFERKKGRDLYDLAIALRQLPIDVGKVVYCFKEYMKNMGLKVSRARFEENLWLKKILKSFRQDIIPLLSIESNNQDFDEDFDLVWQHIMPKLPGDPWHGLKKIKEQGLG